MRSRKYSLDLLRADPAVRGSERRNGPCPPSNPKNNLEGNNLEGGTFQNECNAT